MCTQKTHPWIKTRASGIGSIIAAALTTIILTSCPVPFDSGKLSLLQDLSAPVVTFTAPVAGSAFESSVTVSGTIVDLDKDGISRTGAASEFIESAEYYILGNESEAVTLTLDDEDWSFSFTIETASYDNQITVYVAATDRNGNTGTGSLIVVPDIDGPFLAITSPENYGEYATVITLAGNASNSVSDSAVTELSPTVTYEMPGTDISGSLTLDSAGGFSTTIDASALSGNHTIEVTASDLNGNETTAIVTVVKPSIGGDISGFTVTPGNKRVTIAWESVPYAESYTILESRFGNEVPGIAASATSYSWENLTNGTLYSFQLIANLPESAGSDAYSAKVAAMPLSARTLAPWVRETGYKSITIEWLDSSNIQEYTVERSASPDGPWKVKGNTSNNWYTDSAVGKGTAYFYRITPSEYQDIPSDYVAAVPGHFPSKAERTVAMQATAGNARGIAINGNHAFMAEMDSGITSLDISDPERPIVLDTVDTTDAARSVTVSGTYAYVADENAGLAVIDISDPENLGTPVYCDGAPVWSGIAYDVAVYGGYAFVANWTPGVGIAIVDVSDPAHPADPVYYTLTTGNARSVTVALTGETPYLYVADGASGLAIIDISDLSDLPTSMAAPVYRTTTGSAQAVTVTGGFAFVAVNDFGLDVIDVSDPLNPGIPANEDTDGNAYGIAVTGGYAYLAASTFGLMVLDVSDTSDPGTPVRIDTAGAAWGVAVSGDYAFVADATKGIAAIDISNPNRPALGVSAPASPAFPFLDVAVSGNYAYAADFKQGLAIMDITDIGNPRDPVYCTSGTVPGNSWGVAVSGDHAYLAVYSQGLAIYDISDPVHPTAPVYVDTVGSAAAITIAGDYAYIADMAGGLAVVDISDPAHPEAPVYCVTLGTAYDVAVSGGYAYVADYTSGLTVVDISDPANPRSGQSLDVGGTAAGVTVSGTCAYVATWEVGLVSVDISDPENPSILDAGCGTTTDLANDACVAGGYAFFVYDMDPAFGLAIADATDPAVLGSPVYLTLPGGEHNKITVVGRYALVADGNAGLTVIELWNGNE